MKRLRAILTDTKTRLAAFLVVTVLSVSVSGTLAYFMASTLSIRNDFVPTRLNVVIHESFTKNDDDEYVKENVTFENTVIPGFTSDAYIRVKLIPSWRDDTGHVAGVPASLSGPGITADIDVVDHFNLIDGYYYYKGILAPGETTPVLIRTLTVDYSALTGTVYDGLTFELSVLAEGLNDAPGAAEAAWGMAYNKTSQTWAPYTP